MDNVSRVLDIPPDLAHEADALYARFLQTLSPDMRADITADSSAEAEAGVVAFALFMEYAAQRSKELAMTLCGEFNARFLKERNIHVFVDEHGLDDIQAQTVVRAYLATDAILNICAKRSELDPVLFFSKEFCSIAAFGGQGGMDDYFRETQAIYTTYHPLVAEFVQQMSEFLSVECSKPQLARLYKQGMDVVRWLTMPTSVPDQQYLLSIPVCIPMVGLTQLMLVMATYKTLGITPGQLASSFKATGASSRSAQPDGLTPTQMVAVIKLTRTQVEDAISGYNSCQISDEMKVHLSLVNTSTLFVVSGASRATAAFVNFLKKNYDMEGLDQTRISYSMRKPSVSIKYLSIKAPYHCSLLADACDRACKYAAEQGWSLSAGDMRVAVRACDDGHDIRDEQDLTRYLLRSHLVLPVDWPKAIAVEGITHIVDFGPGGLNGFGALAHKVYEGRGVSVVCAGAFTGSRGSPLASKADLYRTNSRGLKRTPNWEQEYGPRLVRLEHDRSLHIDTPMSRLLGKPPVMVAGMTPSTASEIFVSAVMRAGYHIELSGGGHFSEPMLRDKVDKILKLVDPGLGVTINAIYVNPFLWNIQYPAMQAMRREGTPIEGLCIGAGVPSYEVANEIIANIRAAGLRHIGLKPSSTATIRLVIKIAQANPDFPIILQWTGGRAGGHHSFEDFHHPILETYGA
ncbi:fatty acid synthase alpha subunit Lsd1, partial [Dipsacomyces acuminosporus]